MTRNLLFNFLFEQIILSCWNLFSKAWKCIKFIFNCRLNIIFTFNCVHFMLPKESTISTYSFVAVFWNAKYLKKFIMLNTVSRLVCNLSLRNLSYRIILNLAFLRWTLFWTWSCHFWTKEFFVTIRTIFFQLMISVVLHFKLTIFQF